MGKTSHLEKIFVTPPPPNLGGWPQKNCHGKTLALKFFSLRQNNLYKFGIVGTNLVNVFESPILHIACHDMFFSKNVKCFGSMSL